MAEEFKVLALFQSVPGQPALLGDEIRQNPECKDVCEECPLRGGKGSTQGGYFLDSFVYVPAGTKASKGSIKAGLKRVDGKDIDEDVESVPACFHPDRSTLWQLAIRQMFEDGLIDEIE